MTPLIQKLEQFTRFSSADKQTLAALSADNVKRYGVKEDIISEGDTPEHVNLILTGWAYRYKHLEDGRRQITSFFVPGDLCDLRIFLLKQMDHSIGTLTPVTVAALSRDAILALTDNNSRISRALWWSALVSEAIEREWIVSLGQRRAIERCAHLMCELYQRLLNVDLAEDGRCQWPLTQAELGDATGLSLVHVNRTLHKLRASNLIELNGKSLKIVDIDRLQRAALFSSSYLHTDREGQDDDADEA